ncbi:ABC-type transport auxiliary lipoprotein family protein [Pigmentiphaga litoralis]|uniref:ABC-type transport auxiliary lipoprotein family protein n=1 Tax=Pigmentiphaga litoralis TaxID=516702 RepID=UPI003B431DA3
MSGVSALATAFQRMASRSTSGGSSSAGRAARSGFLGAMVVAVLGACSVLPDAEPVTMYQLPTARPSIPAGTGPDAASTARSRADWSLRVVKPASSAVTDSPRILVLRESNQVNAYQAVRWSDPAPALWRNRLTAAFVDDGRIGALSTDDAPAHADLELAGDLRSFQVEYQGAQPVVALRLDARLVRTGTRRIVASRSFMVMQPVSGSKVPEVVTAFGQAADALSAQVVDWTLTQAPVR